MKNKHIIIIITIFVSLIYISLILYWHLYTPDYKLTVQNPGADNCPEGVTRKADDVFIGEYFMKYAEISSELTGKWSRFRGENSDNKIITTDKINLTDEDFPVIWSVETGEGHAASVIYNGKVYF